ncbi:MAG: hypothetical protein FWB71_05300, partial [Defluviitaleaceae bacterium]|nr:hypothetical protein [Defluviitaleaceae bacterium]
MKKPIDNRVVSVAVSAGALILLIAFLPLFLRDYYPGLVYEPPTAAPAFTRDEQMRELARLIDEGATHRQGRNPFALPVYRTFREDPALFFESAAQTHQSHMEWAARSIATQINRARSADPAIYAVYRGILDSANQEHPAVVALVNASRLAGLPRPAEVSRIVDPRIEMANFGNPREIGNTGDGIANSLTFLFATDDEFARSQAITDILWHLRRNDCQMVLSSLTYLDEHIRYDIINLLVDRLMAIRQIGSPLYQVYAANLARPS